MLRPRGFFIPAVTVCVLLALPLGAVPNLISYQGLLNDQGGSPVTGTVSIVFSLYPVPTGGAALWTETQSVQVSAGVFNVQLGSVQPLTSAVFAQDTVFLGVRVGTDAEMTPRQQLYAVAYSHRAELVTPAVEYVDPPFGGDGSDGPLSLSSGTTSLVRGRVYQYDSINITGSAVINASGGSSNADPIIIKCSGDAVIAGAIDLVGAGMAGGDGQYWSGYGAPGVGIPNYVTGGGGGSDANGSKGGGGGAGAGSQGEATNGVGLAGSWGYGLAAFSPPAVSGAGGGGSGKASSSNWGQKGNGGAGGGAIYLEVAGSLTISGTVNVSGADAGPTHGVEGGGGGGGGGSFVALVGGSISTSGATLLANGGAGAVAPSPAGNSGASGGKGRIFIGVRTR